MSKIITNLIYGDCEDVLGDIKSNTVDLIVTSPPYADSRKHTYGGVKPNKYVEWFLSKSEEMLRILKPDGTFILNIKEGATNGERNTYVLELVLALREQGWLWTEEFIWHKKNSFPGKWPNRFRNSWERLLQFNKQKKFNMYQEEVMLPLGDWAKNRLNSLSEEDKIRRDSKVGSGFGRCVANWTDRDTVYPTNVLHLATETGNQNHSAVFPETIPEWFLKLFTKEGDWVLDPFVGSGTTLKVAHRMGRNSVGIEVMKRCYKAAQNKLQNEKISFTDEKLHKILQRKTKDKSEPKTKSSCVNKIPVV